MVPFIAPEPRLSHWRGNARLAHVLPEWVDIYGHMNMSWYVALFDTLGHDILNDCGLGASYTAQHRMGLFTVRATIDYRREVIAGDPLRVTLRITGHDDKRLRTTLDLHHAGAGYLAATMEQLALHVSLDTRRVTQFPPAVLARLAELNSTDTRPG